MRGTTNITDAEMGAVQEHAQRLGAEVLQLRIQSDLLERLCEASGLDDVVQRLAVLLREAVGGSNVIVYCAAGGQYVFADAFARTRTLDAIDSELARSAFERREPVEGPVLGDRSVPLATWAVPLIAGDEPVAVVVAENAETGLHEAEEGFGAFLRVAALLVARETRDLPPERARSEMSEGNAAPLADRARETTSEAELSRTIQSLQETLELRSRALRTLSRVTETLMQAYDERELLQSVCDIVVDVGGYALCWVGYVEHDGNKSVRPVASAGRDADYVERLDISWGPGPRGRGPTGRSIRRHKPIAVQDLRTDSGFAPWRDEAVRRGYRSSISLPLLDSSGDVIGAIAMYSEAAGSFGDEETRLLSELAGSLAFGITALRERQARREADSKVREAARYSRSLVEVNTNPLVLISPDGKISDVNRATETATGVSRDRLIGTDFADYFTDPDAARTGYQRVLAEGIVNDYPLTLKHTSGSVMDVEYNASVYRDETGAVGGVFAAARDVTEREKARAHQEQLAAVVAASQDAIFTKDFNGVVTSWNEAAHRLFGYSAREMIGTNVEVLTPPERRSEPAELLSRVRRGEVVTEHETVRARSDGVRLDVSISMSPIRDKSGRVVSVSVVSRDITERKRSERERAARLHFVESMDRVNRAIQGTEDLEQMMRSVLDEVLAVFDCDRAFLMYPCDPDSPSWTVPMERFREGFPGVEVLGAEVPMDTDVAETLRLLLAADAPVRFGPGTAHPLPADVSERFGFRSFMSVALRPKIGKPWQFGVHQCTYAREWTDEEASLLAEIGRRLEDALGSMMARRDLGLSEARYRRLVETASEGIMLLSLDAVVTFANRRMGEMLGYSPDEMIGRPLGDFFFEEDLQDNEVRMENRRRGISEEYDRRWRHKGGNVVWTRVAASPVLDEAGEVIGMLGMMTDVTERKRAEDERAARLRFVESMDRVNRAIQGTADLEQMMGDVLDVVLAVFECDRTFLLYPCDPDASSWTVSMERAQPEWGGVTALGADLPMAEDVAAAFRTLLDAGGPVRFGLGLEHPLPRSTAERFAYKAMMSVALRPKVGKPWEFGVQQCSWERQWTDDDAALLQEIGWRLEDALTGMLANRDLKRSEAEYRRLIETAAEGIWVLSPDSITKFANSTMAAMIGYAVDDLVGRPVTDFMFEEDVAEHQRRIERRREGESEVFELRMRSKGGNEVWMSVSAAPIFDDTGQFTGSFGMATDITARREAEEGLRRRNEELERFERLVVGRELKMRELKDKIAQLERMLAEVPGGGSDA